MDPAVARAIADETIRFWQRDVRPPMNKPTCCMVWREITGTPYPGGGWERVRMAMVDWLIEQDAEALRRTA